MENIHNDSAINWILKGNESGNLRAHPLKELVIMPHAYIYIYEAAEIVAT